MTSKLAHGLRAFAVPLLAAALAACGGGDGGGSNDSPAPTPVGSTDPTSVAVAANDTASVDWNTTTTLAVTSNDTAQNGAVALTIKTPPAHGTASVVGTSIAYAPTAGYFGPDTVGYTLTVGDKSADAAVDLSVSAVLKLSGTVRDAPLPGAVVTASLAGTDLPAVTADADGHYTLTLRVADPTAFIKLTAQGAGTQSNVVLTSLVGDAGEAAAAIEPTTGTVAAAALPSTNVTHVSTAIAVLAEQSLGKPVTSAADLQTAQGGFTASQTIEMATAIKLVVDNGIALPSGTADTLALVAKPEVLKTFVLAQATANPQAYNAVQQSVLGDPSLASPSIAPSSASAPAKTLLLVQGEGAGANSATRLTLQGDGSALVESDARRTARWTSDGTDLVVTYDTPAVGQGFSNDTDANGNQYAVETSETGFILRQVGGSGAGGTASVKSVSSTKYLQGPKVGNGSTPDSNDWDAQTLVGSSQPITDADVAAGTRWAGVMALDFSPATSSTTEQDVAKIVDATTVVFERSGTAGSYRLVDGKLEITVADAVYTYSRLFVGPRGEQRWLAVKSTNGVVQWLYEPAVVKAQLAVSFTTDGLAQAWQSYVNVGITSGQFEIDLASDGTGVGVSRDASGTVVGMQSSGNWGLDADGNMVLKRYGCTPGQAGCEPFGKRTWTLLASVDKRIYVMERLTYADPSNGYYVYYDQYRINVYTRP